MERKEAECLLEAIEAIVKAQHRLSARLDATEQAIQAWPQRPTQPRRSVIDSGQETSDPAISSGGNDEGSDGEDGDNVEPLDWVRLDGIKRDVSDKASTWESLRKQYPPGQSVFASLSFAANSWAALTRAGVSEPDDKLAVDEVYSQAAAMAAYGVELLRVALSSSQVDRGHMRQASNVLATLCATLTDTRDQHRDVIANMAIKRADAFRRAQSDTEESEPEPVIPLKRTRKRTSQPARHLRRRNSGPVANELIHPYHCYSLRSKSSRPHLQQQRQQQSQQQSQSHESSSELSNLDAVLLDNPTESTPVLIQAPGSVDLEEIPAAIPLATVPSSDITAADSAGEASSASAVDVAPASAATRTNRQRLAVGIRYQSIVRDALLRQGQSESAITVYFDQFSKGTTKKYNNAWRRWAGWCIGRHLDPLLRSAVDLDTCISEGHFSTLWAKRVKRQGEVTWSIVEGLPPPAFNNGRQLHSYR